MTHDDDTLMFLNSANAEYIAHLYARYMVNPEEVDESWRRFFDDLDDNETALMRELSGASWTPEENRKIHRGFNGHGAAVENVETRNVTTTERDVAKQEGQRLDEQALRQAAHDSVRALMLIRAYRARGHLVANLDPLNLQTRGAHPELDPAHYGFGEEDYERPIFINGVLGMEYATLHEILDALRAIYCDTIGVEFLHLTDPDEKTWVQQRIEATHNRTDFTENGKRAILQRLTAAEYFETFLHKKYVATKRFGIDGGEALIPAIEQILKRGGQMGLEEIVIGMPHRGRLNVLGNVMGKSFTAIFAEFQGQAADPGEMLGSGDVKYHLGTSSDRDFDGNTVHLSLTANPSHLEAVNPVVSGKARAKQRQHDDETGAKVMPFLMHGDASFAGQGLVAETLMISELPGYSVGGTVHVIVNNQIGFTTTPKYGRSGPYPTDVAKMLAAPIFHVNGDDPEAVVHVARIATEFRQTFKKDVVIDMFCYRRHGHNEADEPSFTQPVMYQKIANQETTRKQYAARLIGENIISQEEADSLVSDFHDHLNQAFEATKSYKPNDADFLEGAWSGFRLAHGEERKGKTDIDADRLQRLGEIVASVPADFDLHKKLRRLFDNRKTMLEEGCALDWATAEQLAYASLLEDGFDVRISGQDSGRGTFSHRHAILYDQTTGEKYFQLKHLAEDQGKFEIHDSPLSEAAVLGFEYGYSLAEPNSLTIWEAQFGDFVNGAQVIIDQFLSSGEVKWLRMSGLVLFLPHGYEGQGPEHSSARLERFLKLSAEDNWQVANCTTPANFFHILRRQMKRDFRKPLIIMTPKSLLRHRECVSNPESFLDGSSFHRILWDSERDRLVANDKIQRVVLCSGKVYYDLLEARREQGIDNITILRLEQLYPFPAKSLQRELGHYPNADIVWCQEEPWNMGAWHFVNERIENVLRHMDHACKRPRYIGREEAASPATGIAQWHKQEQAALVEEALDLKS